MAFNKLFPRTIHLQISKRLTDPDQITKMMRLCDDLRDEVKPFREIINDAGLRVIKFDELTAADTDPKFTHITAYNRTMHKVDEFCAKHQPIVLAKGEYVVGESLVGKGSFGKGSTKISSNEWYTVHRLPSACGELDFTDLHACGPSERKVLEREAANYVLKTMSGELRYVSKANMTKHIRRAFAKTCHSLQGVTCRDRIYIHDINLASHSISDFITYSWLRTAISRTSNFDVIIVQTTQTERTMADYAADCSIVAKRIVGHQAADIEKFGELSADVLHNYVTPEWSLLRLKFQKYTCHHCPAAINDVYEWSIDRLINTRPHNKSNCVLACLKCQASSSHRE
jgi:hypothetical protein